MSWSNKCFATVLAVSMLAAVPAHAADQCGVNLFNPQLLLQADFKFGNNNTYSGVWNGHLNRYIAQYPFGFVPGRAYKITYTLNCDDPEAGNQYLTFVNDSNEIIPMDSNACAGNDGHVEIIAPQGTKIKGLTVATLDGVPTYKGGVIISDLMLTDAGVNTADFIAYNPCTRVATQVMLDNSLYGTRERLNYVAGVITDLIAQSKTNTGDIGRLVTKKQTRPATGCAEGYDSCLLVKDDEGKNVWYPIETCNGNPFLSNISSNGAVTINNHDYSLGVNGCSNEVASYLGCDSDEVTMVYQNGIVFIEQIGLNIANGTGSIVSLPAGTTGEAGALHSLCRVTGYRVKNGDGTFQPRQNIDTNLWIVNDGEGDGGNCYRYLNADNNYVTEYYAAVANTCLDSVPMANMCTVDGFLNNVGSQASYSFNGNNVNDALCTSQYSGIGCNSGETIEAWSNGIIFGEYKGVSIEQTTRGQIVSLPSSVPSGDVCVCRVKGYRQLNNGNLGDRHNVNTNLWVIAGESANSCDSLCMRYMVGNLGNNEAQTEIKAYYAAIADSCAGGFTEGTIVQRSNPNPGCDVIENLVEPGNFRGGGEAWKSFGGSNELAGGKACDGRWGLYTDDPNNPAYVYGHGITNGINAPGVSPTTNSCRNNEWLHVYSNVGVYGQARMVAITQDTPGTIVSLPNNVQDVNVGGVCVCRIKAYVPVLETDEYGNPIHFGNRVDLPTPLANKWVIAGRRTAGAYSQNESGLHTCITDCAFYTDSYTVAYYDAVGNSCSNATVTEATPCDVDTNSDQYTSFVNSSVNNKWIQALEAGSAYGEKQYTGLCDKNSNAAYCAMERGDLSTWALSFSATDPTQYFKGVSGEDNAKYNEHYNYNNGTGVVYGRARCVEDKQGNFNNLGTDGKVVVLDEIPENSEKSGTVCIQNLSGYQLPGDKAETMVVASKYWYAKKYESVRGCIEGCRSPNAVTLMSEVEDLVAPVSGMCITDK